MSNALPLDGLTIAIPSFNRADTLSRNLEQVADKLPSWVRILVLDNCSEPAFFPSEVLRQKLTRSGATLRVVRHATNVGSSANILRCFELVETSWFLLCGDDDPVIPEALPRLRDLTHLHIDKAFIKLSSRFHNYPQERSDLTITEALRSHGNFSGYLFMSSFVFNVEKCRPYLRFGYMMSAASATQLAVALLAGGKFGFVLSDLTATLANEADASWSPVDVVLSSYYLTDLPLAPDEREALVRLIYRTHNVGRELTDIAAIYANGPIEEASFLRSKALRVHRGFGRGLRRYVALIGLTLLPLFKGVAFSVLKQLYERARGTSYSRKFIARHDRL